MGVSDMAFPLNSSIALSTDIFISSSVEVRYPPVNPSPTPNPSFITVKVGLLANRPRRLDVKSRLLCTKTECRCKPDKTHNKLLELVSLELIKLKIVCAGFAGSMLLFVNSWLLC